VLFGGRAIFGSGPATAGVWTHLALVRNNGTATLYVNGVASGSSTASPNMPAGSFAIGAQPQSLAAEFFAGALDEVRVFSFNPGQFSPDGLSYQPTESLGYSYPPSESGESLFDFAWSLDQRGYPRVANGAADIGAVEVQQSVVRVTDNAGNGSLRQVLADVTPPGVITFAPALSGQTITLNSELAVLRSPVAVHGGGLPAGVTVVGSGGSRILSVSAGVTVELRDLTFTGGTGGGTDMPQHGGALFNRGALTLRRCTFAGNSTSYGGVLFNDFTGTLVLDQCTLSGNSAIAEAGAIYHRGVSMLAHHCTISGNQAPAFGAIYNDDSIPVSLNNTILAGNTGSNGADLHNRGTLTRIGANMLAGYVQFGVGSSTGPAAITSTLLLAPLANYGGPTQTMPPLPGSPAIDGCTSGTSFGTDQRGQPRIVGAFADIGSVEAFPFSTISLVDADGDGADDRMELGYFGNLATITTSSDADGDGSPDVAELANMTNPQDSGDNLRISSFTPAAGFNAASSPLFDVTVRTFPGLSYTLQTNATLSAFTDVPGTTFTATNHSQTLQIRLTPGRDFLRARRN
ncbi:MAG: LamG domain-containing protein, partial [Verrucomicrobia subdivision 3 bacterium]|nr:LamG domain-containing protein [Limisphaerales bacterium]